MNGLEQDCGRSTNDETLNVPQEMNVPGEETQPKLANRCGFSRAAPSLRPDLSDRLEKLRPPEWLDQIGGDPAPLRFLAPARRVESGDEDDRHLAMRQLHGVDQFEPGHCR